MTAYTISALRQARTFLFVPANRPDRFSKAVASQADVVILDLEDAVPESEKLIAREHARTWLAAGNAAVVRVNAAGTKWHEDDIRMVASSSAALMLPKADDVGAIESFAEIGPQSPIIPLIETSRGILTASSLCMVTAVVRVALGHIDLAGELGVNPDDREALLFARSTLIAASAAANLAPPVDGVTTSWSDAARLADDARYAKKLGMSAKLCIHPAQVIPVDTALAPSRDEVAWAKRVVGAVCEDRGAVAIDGAMVDLPVVNRARRILAERPRC
ncbi:HpcH/HpaI aldolase/citrate lyase family protein [Mycobacterium sp. SMC-4]|uniref:HpcH/HpaI aldolase/citrate lyase family protein n=1 Tax=Mycobacterium sp. SMC-4 TaxID=2857059 RepID=UPI003CFFE3BA